MSADLEGALVVTLREGIHALWILRVRVITSNLSLLTVYNAAMFQLVYGESESMCFLHEAFSEPLSL